MFDDTIYISGNDYYNKCWDDCVDIENKVKILKKNKNERIDLYKSKKL